MRGTLILLIVLLGCKEQTAVPSNHDVQKDSVLEVFWDIHNGDTISGGSISVINGDTVIEDFGVNPAWGGENK